MTPRVVVVGAGISGLATAFHLRTLRPDRPPEVVVLEARDRAGGHVRTDTDGGCVREGGPNGFLDDVPWTLDLVRALGLEARLRRAREAAAVRFVWRRGALRRLPASPGEFLRSSVLSLPGRVRVLLEPFAAGPPGGDESVHDFARRRFGREAAEVLVDALVAGVFAGDPRSLSLRSAFPSMAEMERTHGSLIRALKAKRSEGPGAGLGPGGALRSFDGGMEVLTGALAARLGGAVRTGLPVARVVRLGERWVVQAADGRIHEAESVVVAAPAAAAGRMLAKVDPRLSAPLEEIRSAPVVVVALRYPEAAAPRAGDGFGFLVPSGQGPRILGALFDSTIFEGRAPAGEVLIRAMAGGARAPGLVRLPDAGLLALVREDLRRTMGITVDPLEVRIVRHAAGIPQYAPGHADRLAAIEAALRDKPGLHLTGNSYRGVSLNLCCRDALATAEAVLDRMGP